MVKKPKRKYPHMLDVDVPVWDAWLKKFHREGYIYEYDVKVGEGITPAPALSAAMKDWAVRLTKKRIDVVLHRPNEVLLVEVKTVASMYAIAQLVSYPILYDATFRPPYPSKSLLVAERLLLDVEMLLRRLAIDFALVTVERKPLSSPPEQRSPAE